MIGVVATVYILEDKIAEFENLARGLETNVKQHEPGCLVYRMAKSRTRPNTYVNMEIFRDQAALDQHQAAEYFQTALGGYAACLSGAPDVEYFDTIS
jgi:quinol monooxygenase YgiN